jgi:hypothetical protein
LILLQGQKLKWKVYDSTPMRIARWFKFPFKVSTATGRGLLGFYSQLLKSGGGLTGKALSIGGELFTTALKMLPILATAAGKTAVAGANALGTFYKGMWGATKVGGKLATEVVKKIPKPNGGLRRLIGAGARLSWPMFKGTWKLGFSALKGTGRAGVFVTRRLLGLPDLPGDVRATAAINEQMLAVHVGSKLDTIIDMIGAMTSGGAKVHKFFGANGGLRANSYSDIELRAKEAEKEARDISVAENVALIAEAITGHAAVPGKGTLGDKIRDLLGGARNIFNRDQGMDPNDPNNPNKDASSSHIRTTTQTQGLLDEAANAAIAGQAGLSLFQRAKLSAKAKGLKMKEKFKSAREKIGEKIKRSPSKTLANTERILEDGTTIATAGAASKGIFGRMADKMRNSRIGKTLGKLRGKGNLAGEAESLAEGASSVGKAGAILKGAGKLLGGAGLAYAGYETAKDIKDKNYWGAAGNAATGLIGSSLLGVDILGSLGSMAGGTAAAAAGLLTNPVGWTILGMAAVAGTGYAIWKHISKNKTKKSEDIVYPSLLARYGSELGQIHPIKKLEELTYQRVEKYNTTQFNALFDDKEFQSIASSFGFNPESRDEMNYFCGWYALRFIPMFVTRVEILRKSFHLEWNQLGKLDEKQIASFNQMMKTAYIQLDKQKQVAIYTSTIRGYMRVVRKLGDHVDSSVAKRADLQDKWFSDYASKKNGKVKLNKDSGWSFKKTAFSIASATGLAYLWDKMHGGSNPKNSTGWSFTSKTTTTDTTRTNTKYTQSSTGFHPIQWVENNFAKLGFGAGAGVAAIDLGKTRIGKSRAASTIKGIIEQWGGYAQQAAEFASQQQGVQFPLQIGIGLIAQESGGNANAESGAHAHGLVQIMPGTAATLAPKLGTTAEQILYDPLTNLMAGYYYLAGLFKMFKSWDKALTAYNWGPGNVIRYEKGLVNFMPAESINYAPGVLANAKTAETLLVALGKKPDTSKKTASNKSNTGATVAKAAVTAGIVGAGALAATSAISKIPTSPMRNGTAGYSLAPVPSGKVTHVSMPNAKVTPIKIHPITKATHPTTKSVVHAVAKNTPKLVKPAAVVATTAVAATATASAAHHNNAVKPAAYTEPKQQVVKPAKVAAAMNMPKMDDKTNDILKESVRVQVQQYNALLDINKNLILLIQVSQGGKLSAEHMNQLKNISAKLDNIPSQQPTAVVHTNTAKKEVHNNSQGVSLKKQHAVNI